MKYLIIAAAALSLASCKKSRCYSCGVEVYSTKYNQWFSEMNADNYCGKDFESHKKQMEANRKRLINCEEIK
jgi:DNA-directed RNA polymerase subunit N (RpoN/RPB10)